VLFGDGHRIVQQKATYPNLTGLAFSEADSWHALHFGAQSVKQSTNYLVERVGVFCLYGLETKIGLIQGCQGAFLGKK